MSSLQCASFSSSGLGAQSHNLCRRCRSRLSHCRPAPPVISNNWIGGAMMGVVNKFFIASMLMWTAPIAVLYGFNHNLFPGSGQLSPESTTLWSGILAVISVNMVIVFYIYSAMKEPSDKHVPDPAFLADAKASINQSGPTEEDSSSDRAKQE